MSAFTKIKKVLWGLLPDMSRSPKGKIIAESLMDNPEDWRFSSGVLVNHKMGYRILFTGKRTIQYAEILASHPYAKAGELKLTVRDKRVIEYFVKQKFYIHI